MEYLTKDDIILINQKTIKRHGGNFVPPFNILNENPLDYLVEAVQSEMFGKPLYPEIYDKAGLYMFSISNNHIFQDGNKRTGLGSALLFMRLNWYTLKNDLAKITSNEGKFVPKKGNTNTELLIEFSLELASGEVTLEECQRWLKENMEPFEYAL